MGRRRRSDVLTQAILASAPDAVVVLDDGGAVVEFNPAAERMFGVRRDSVIGSELYDGMLLPNSQAERAPLDRSYEATATRSDGATFPAEVSTAPVVGVDARLRVLYVRDISERRRAQRALYDLAAIIESSEDAIISKTLDGVIESWNAGAERLYGHTAAEAIGRGLAKVEPNSPNTLIAYSAKAGSTAQDGDGKNSQFTIALAKHLTTPGLDVRKAFGFVRDDVLKSTGNRQEPFVYGSLGGDDVPLVPVRAAPIPQAKSENADSDRRRNATSPASLRSAATSSSGEDRSSTDCNGPPNRPWSP